MWLSIAGELKVGKWLKFRKTSFEANDNTKRQENKRANKNCFGFVFGKKGDEKKNEGDGGGEGEGKGNEMRDR